MCKTNNEFYSDSRQCSVCRIEKGGNGDIDHQSEQLPFEYVPRCFGYVEIRAVWRQEEKKQPTALPYRFEFCDKSTAVNAGVAHLSIL